MIRHGRDVQALAICLAALAGYVDAVAFVETHGFFVSFMSGNTTRLGVGFAQHTRSAAIAAGLVGTFVLGVAIGSLTGHAAKARRRVAVLLLVAILLTLGAGSAALGERTVAIVAMALAMGAENAVFERDGEIQIGLTYMTGTLVKLGQRLAALFRGGDPTGWASYLLLWMGLFAGATAGATVDAAIGLSALWCGATVSALLAVITFVVDRRHIAA